MVCNTGLITDSLNFHRSHMGTNQRRDRTQESRARGPSSQFSAKHSVPDLLILYRFQRYLLMSWQFVGCFVW